MKDILSLLAAYEPFNERERVDKVHMLEYCKRFPDIFERTNFIAHMCASPWIIDESGEYVILAHHNIYQSWGWCGGHCDNDWDVWKVALQEGMQESGLQQLDLVDDQIFAIDILPVHAHQKNNAWVSAHLHLNITFLCMADRSALLKHKADENSDVRWFPTKEIHQVVEEKKMLQVYDKLTQKVTFLKNSNKL